MSTRHLSRKELAEISASANRDFFSRPERIDRIRNGYSSPYVWKKFATYQAAAEMIEDRIPRVGLICAPRR
jgi:hypothetical protein